LSKDVIKEVLSTCKTIAVVGLSREPEKDSYQVAKYIQKHGYHIIPVNPFADEVLCEKSYKSLLDIPGRDPEGNRRG
jgi:predicted CoA-binding protein